MRYPIATALRRLRLDASLTQAQLAERLGCAQANVSEREGHAKDMRSRELELYAAAFSCDVPTLLERMAAAIRAES